MMNKEYHSIKNKIPFLSDIIKLKPAMHLVIEFLLQGGVNDQEDSGDEEAPEITQWETIGWLAILTLWISILSGYLVDAIEVKHSFQSNFYLFTCVSLTAIPFKSHQPSKTLIYKGNKLNLL